MREIISFFIILLSCAPLRLSAEDFTNLGGDLTTDSPGRFAIQLPAPNLTEPVRRNTMLEGFTVFHALFGKAEGVGPFFVNNSCGGCHIQNGKGAVKFPKSTRRLASAVVQVSRKGLDTDGSPRPVPGVGIVLQERNLRGKRRYDIGVKWRRIKGKYNDGTAYRLRRPQLTFEIRGKNPRKVLSSLRMSPAIIGTGLIQAIPDSAIEALADIDDADQDGISGKPNYVVDLRTNQRVIGRFGFKGTQPTVEQQSLTAFVNEMGVTNVLFPDRKGRADEIGAVDIERLDFYQRFAGVPAARNQSDADVQAGQDIFTRIGCQKCHTPTFTTSSVNDPELDGQVIHPFSDFLLHDMGPGLADKRPVFDASGSEWRTTPLWGLGFAETISNVRPVFLHDGRAKTIEEAILWHGGEGLASRTEFRQLVQSERDQLVAFLRSL